MKERLISLAWAAPWMLFLGFPLAQALDVTDRGQRAAIIGLCALLAVANSAVWLTNPLPARNSFTRPFILSHTALAAATAVYLAYATSVGLPYSFMLTSYLLVAWIFQAPSRFLIAGVVPIAVIAGVAAYAQGESMWTIWYLAMLGGFVGFARWGMERSARERLHRQDAIQRAKAGERARLSTDLHDILGHSLTGISMLSELAGRLLDAGRTAEAREQIRAITAQSNEALADVRRIVAATRALSPIEELDEARSLLEVARIDADITNEGEPASGPRSAAAAHVIREGVTNAILHARPSRVQICLSSDGVTVTNDGYTASYAASTAGAGSGLSGLSELVGDEGTLTWGASGSTWTLALSFPEADAAATPDEIPEANKPR